MLYRLRSLPPGERICQRTLTDGMAGRLGFHLFDDNAHAFNGKRKTCIGDNSQHQLFQLGSCHAVPDRSRDMDFKLSATTQSRQYRDNNKTPIPTWQLRPRPYLAKSEFYGIPSTRRQ